MQRRVFVGAAFSGLAGSAMSARPAKVKPGDIPRRPLGKTAEQLTIIGQGGGRFHLIPLEEGKALVLRAYELGIRYFDIGRGYWGGRAEEVYGAVLPAFRKNVFLTTQSSRRGRKEAEAELNLSLKTLKTDYVDLWVMHGVGESDEVARIFAPGGAIEAFEAAKKAGKCRFIGFSGHYDPSVIVEMLKNYGNFDTVLMPLHIADPAYLSFEKLALPAAVDRGLGAIGIKIFANASLLRAFSVSDCLRYVLSLPVTSVALGFSTIGQLEDDVRVAQQFKPLTSEEMKALRARTEETELGALKGPALEYWKRKLPGA